MDKRTPDCQSCFEDGYAEGEKASGAAELLEALEAVEWVDRLTSDMHTVERVCAWCGGQSVFVGHKDDCPRQAAIARAKGE